MRCLCLGLVLLLLACDDGASETAAKPTAEPSAAADPAVPRERTKLTNVTMRDIVDGTIAQGRGERAPTPPTPPSPVPIDPLPPEEPAPTGSSVPLPPPATTTTSTTAPLPADQLAVGDRVMAQWTNGRWYPGRIVAIRDGKYDINYDDGDRSRGLPAAKVRKARPRSGGGGGVARRTDDAPCPGPGLTRRCNGKCVNIQTDSNHCGGCNNRCPDGKRCDGHMFCRDAAGNL